MKNASDLLEHLHQKHKEYRAKEPLLRRGIDSDWVCVITPWMETALRHRYDDLLGECH